MPPDRPPSKPVPPAATWGMILGLLTAGCTGGPSPGGINHSQRPSCVDPSQTTDPCAGATGTCTSFPGLYLSDGGECVFPSGYDAGALGQEPEGIQCGFCNG